MEGGGGNKTKQNKSNTAQLARFPRSSLACLFTHFMLSFPPFFFFAVTVVSSLLYESLPCKINSFNAIGIFFCFYA